MSYRYAIIGAGRMGRAAAYDLAKFGDPQELLILDKDLKFARDSVERVNSLVNNNVVSAAQVDINNSDQLETILDGVDSILSAVPYQFNLALTELALKVGAHLCDLGGHTGIVRQQLKMDSAAKSKGITIVPDCGMGPGMNISLALYAMSLLDDPREVYIWDGGLPQDPQPPWNYVLTFNIGGLTNEYYGNAYFIRDGKVVEVPCFEGYEQLELPEPLGMLEAFVTSGGLSTMPWTYESKLERLENKTLRYPGHYAQFKTFSELGLLEPEPLQLGNQKISPREILHELLEPQLTQPDVHDVCVIRVKCISETTETIVELIDYYDERTGFTAMQRLTGWHASIVAIQSVQGGLEPGAIPIELAVPGTVVVEEAIRRGFKIEVKIN